MKKRLISLLLAGLLVLSLCACGGQNTNGTSGKETQPARSEQLSTPEAPDAAQAAEPETPAEDPNETRELVLASAADLVPGEGDGYYVGIAAYVWEALINCDDSGQLQPWLATEWSQENDAKEWTIKLRENVSFQDGTAFNADTCIANFERYAKGPFTSTYTTISMEKTCPGLIEIQKVDDHTIKFIFEKPVPAFPEKLSDLGSPMYSPSCFSEETGEVTSMVIGTGPYRVVDHVENDYALLERFEGYWGEPAKIKNVRIRVIADPETRVSALRSEEVQGLLGYGAMRHLAAKELVESDSRFTMQPTKSHMTHYIKQNGTRFPFNDVRMRQAVSYAIDREQINETLYGGLLTPAYGLLNYNTIYYSDPEGDFGYDMDKAKALAKEVLGEERCPIVMIVAKYRLDRYPFQEEAAYIQQQLQELGFDVDIQILETATFNEMRKNGEFDLALDCHGLMAPADPQSSMSTYMASTGSSNVNHLLGNNDPEVDALFAEVAVELDVDKRMELYRQLQQISAERLPMIPLHYDIDVNVYNAEQIQNFRTENYDGVAIPAIEWVR